MTEKVLPYDPSVVPQEKYWDCGPASVQVALNSRGINLSEDNIIAQLNASIDPVHRIDEDGTDYIGLLEVILDQLLPAANYTVVDLPNDPPTAPQVNQLRLNIKRSIDAGYVVLVNWWVPANNRPRGVKGSANPSYPATLIMHYVTIVGYDDGDDAVKIADPGFAPFEYWITVAQLASLIAPKGYCYANAEPTGDQPGPGLPTPVQPDAATVLWKAVPIIDMATARALVDRISEGLDLAQCNTPRRIAMWLAQIGHESDGFRATEEYQKNGPDWSDDRRIYLGRTWIQITWKTNYAGFSLWCYQGTFVNSPTYFVDNPRELAEDEWAAIGPAWYWTVARAGINAMCDAGDLVGVTKAINGGTNGLEDSNGSPGRRTRYNQALALGDELLALTANGDEDEMAGWTPDTVQEALMLLRNTADVKRKSASPLRWPNEAEIDTSVGFARLADGTSHVILVEKLTVEYGDPENIALLWAVSQTDEPGRQNDAALAQRILDKVPADFVAAAKPVIEQWLNAVNA